MLGAPLEPNSIKINSQLNYRFTPFLNVGLGYSLMKHGKNIYNENGNLIKSVGGDVFRFLTINDEQNVYLLKGDIETTRQMVLFLVYEVYLGYVLRLDYNYTRYNFKKLNQSTHNLFLTFYLDFN